MIIELGTGNVEIVTLRQGDKVGVLLRRLDAVHNIGELTDTGGTEYTPEENSTDVTIWLNQLDSARVLQDAVNQAILNLQGLTGE